VSVEEAREILAYVTIDNIYGSVPDPDWDAVEDAIATIFAAHDAQQADLARLREAERWVPVTERLPTESYGCLVMVDEDDYFGEVRSVLLPYVVGYDGEGWNDIDGQTIPFEVTHWKRIVLPAGPEEGKDGEGNAAD
jgi:hypothetical protein